MLKRRNIDPRIEEDSQETLKESLDTITEVIHI